MSILWRLIFFGRCTSTHHKLALDSLRFIRGPQADLWANLFLSNHEQYLAGAKAPDNEFKDFKNHVLHVNDGFWGGATSAARMWYQKTVAALSQGDWPEAIFNAGVLSHYFTDPFQPFHTGQSEAEGTVHRAAEWSICKSYEDLQAILEHELSGYPDYELATRPDWLEEAIRQGAVTAHESYEVCIDHYDLSRGIKHPPSGLDQESKDRLARLIGMAVVGFARVLERAFEESAASPPDVAVSLHAFLATLKLPLNWIRKKFTDLHERAVIEAIYLESQEKGKVIDALPEDERTVRKLYAQEVLKVPVRQLDAEPARTTGTQYGTGAPSRGETVQAVSSAGFQRTVISKSQPAVAQRGPVPTLELCLMVPLATEPPKDFVADAAVRAYLNQSGRSDDDGNKPFRATTENATQLLPASSTEIKSQVSAPAIARPSIASPGAPTRSELDKQERRLQMQRQRLADLEPTLLPPTLPVTPLGSTNTTLIDEAMPVEMFAPLPPLPQLPSRDSAHTALTTKLEAISSAPQPVAAIPVPRATEPAARSVTPVSSPTPTAKPDAKTYTAHSVEPSVVPAPHVRLPEPVPEAEPQASPFVFKNRLSPPGQMAGFDFRHFSGVTLQTDSVEPQAPPPAPRVPTPAPGPTHGQSSVSQPAANSSGSAATRRFYLDLSSPVVDAPTIGPKTADRLQSVGIRTVADLLRSDAGTLAEKVGSRAATQIIRDWQDQARLVCRVPNLRGHDAQFLVACQVRTAEQLRACEPHQLLQQVSSFLNTSVGQRLLRGGTAPDLAEVTEWIVAAKDARVLM